MPVLTDPLGWFTLTFPEGWRPETEDCVTTLHSPVGVAFVSGGRHAGGRQASFGGADFLARFLRSIGVAVDDDEIASATGSDCLIYSHARDVDGQHWRYWSITDDETALLVSYTCPSEDRGREADEVDEIVESVRLFHSATVH